KGISALSVQLDNGDLMSLHVGPDRVIGEVRDGQILVKAGTDINGLQVTSAVLTEDHGKLQLEGLTYQIDEIAGVRLSKAATVEMDSSGLQTYDFPAGGLDMPGVSARFEGSFFDQTR